MTPAPSEAVQALPVVPTRRYGLDDARTVLRWYATADPRLLHAAGVPERRAMLELLGWVRVTRVQRLVAGEWRTTVERTELTAAGWAAVRPHSYDPEPGTVDGPFADYAPCRTCHDVYRAEQHSSPTPPQIGASA